MNRDQAIALVMARVATFEDDEGWTYQVEGAREHATVWAVAVRPFAPDGRPAYNFCSFDVEKATGIVRQF